MIEQKQEQTHGQILEEVQDRIMADIFKDKMTLVIVTAVVVGIPLMAMPGFIADNYNADYYKVLMSVFFVVMIYSAIITVIKHWSR